MDFNLFDSEKRNVFFEKLLNTFLDAIDEATIITENNKILYINHKYADYVGYSKKEIFQMSPLDFIHPDSLEIAKKNIATKSEIPYEIWAKRKDGSQFPVLISPSMFEFEERQFRIISIRDLTSEKQNSRIELLLSKTMEQSHESIVITDPETNIIYANQQFCKLTGYTKKEVIGQNPKILQSGKHSKKFYESMWSILVKGKSWKGEFQNKKKDGTIYYEKATITPILDKDGKIQSYLGIKEDITQQKIIERNFKDSEIKYHELIKNAPLAIINFDTQGRITLINQMMINLLGSPSIEQTKKINVLEFPLLKKAGVSEQFQKCIDTKEKIRFESQYTSKWGKTIFYRLFLSPIVNSHNEVTDILGIAEDISKEKIIEKKILEAKEKAEETDRLKNIFLANMSHELRTPLNTIIGFSEFLNEAENLSAEQKEYITYINNGTNHLLKLINDLLDVSQIESKKLTYTMEDVKVCELFQAIVPVAKTQLSYFQKENIELIINPHDDINEVVLNIDKDRFIQIITNLVNNAIKYTEKGKVEISCTVQNNEFTICVQDTGIGIPEDKHTVIFERFRQVDERLSRKYEGSGLGLTLVKELVTLMKGRIWFESTLNKGSSFYVSFPISETKKTVISEKKDNTNQTSKQQFKDEKFTVLLVEDNIQNKILIRNILQTYNFHVLEANNGKEAIDLLNETPYINVILMDLQMPIMDGLEATKIIRKTNPTIPIIAQTALVLPEDKEKALKAGCNDVLLKPFKKDQLLLKIIDNLKMS